MVAIIDELISANKCPGNMAISKLWYLLVPSCLVPLWDLLISTMTLSVMI